MRCRTPWQVCASNEGDNNLQRIESVERLIYAGPPKYMTKKEDKLRYMQRPIILINPVLEAIHSMASATRKVKPMFMSDFEMVYYLQPQFSHSNALDAALFKTVCQPAGPGLWQVWVRENGPLNAWGDGDIDGNDSTLCSIETAWGGRPAIFTLIWEKHSFPSDHDLTFLADMTSIDWSGEQQRPL